MKDIKALAQAAKNRLRGICEQKKASPKLRLIKGGEGVIKVIAPEQENEKLYQKYKQVLLSDCIHNPLGQMIDKKVYNKLDPENKEKYFFETLEKYKLLKEKYCNQTSEGLGLFA